MTGFCAECGDTYVEDDLGVCDDCVRTRDECASTDALRASTAMYTIELQADVEAVDHSRALIIVALDLLNSAFTNNEDRAIPFEPPVLGGISSLHLSFKRDD